MANVYDELSKKAAQRVKKTTESKSVYTNSNREAAKAIMSGYDMDALIKEENRLKKAENDYIKITTPNSPQNNIIDVSDGRVKLSAAENFFNPSTPMGRGEVIADSPLLVNAPKDKIVVEPEAYEAAKKATEQQKANKEAAERAELMAKLAANTEQLEREQAKAAIEKYNENFGASSGSNYNSFANRDVSDKIQQIKRNKAMDEENKEKELYTETYLTTLNEQRKKAGLTHLSDEALQDYINLLDANRLSMSDPAYIQNQKRDELTSIQLTYGAILSDNFASAAEKGANMSSDYLSENGLKEIHNIINGNKGLADGSSNRVYSMLEDIEKQVWNYYIGSGHSKKALEYINSMMPVLEDRLARQRAAEFDEQGAWGDIKEGTQAILGGLESGTKDMFNSILGTANAFGYELSPLQARGFKPSYAEQLTNYVLADESGTDGKITNMFYQALNSIGYQLPKYAGDFLGIGKIAAIGQALGRHTTEGVRSGENDIRNVIMGLYDGYIEYGMDKLLGGVSSQIAGKGASTITKFLLNKVDDALKNPTVKKMLSKAIIGLSTAGNEFVEEFFQNMAEPAARGIIYGETMNYSWETVGNALKAGAIGMIAGGLMGVTQVNKIYNQRQLETFGKNIIETGKVNSIVKFAEDFGDIDSEAYASVKEAINNKTKIEPTDIATLYIQTKNNFDNFSEADVAKFIQNTASKVDRDTIATTFFNGNTEAADKFIEKYSNMDIDNDADMRPGTASSVIQEFDKLGNISTLSAANKKVDPVQKSINSVTGYTELSNDQQALKKMGEQFGAKVKFANLTVKKGKKVFSPEGIYDPKTNTVTLNTDARPEHRPALFILKHELSHSLEIDKEYFVRFEGEVFKSEAFEQYMHKRGFDSLNAWQQDVIDRYEKQGINFEGDKRVGANKEIVADFVADILFTSDTKTTEQFLKGLSLESQKGFIEAVKRFFAKLKAFFVGDAKLSEIERLEKQFLEVANKVAKMNKAETEQQKTTTDSAKSVNENLSESTESVGVEYDKESNSASPVSYSLASWERSDYVTNRNIAAKELAEAIGVTEKQAKDYIDSINSIAKVIADDQMRLDYDSSKGRSSFVSNAEYGGSVDFSTLCPKRKILTGTFSAIQKALKNSALTAEEILDIRNKMKEKGLEVSCGLCYVEGSRAQMGKFSKEFIERYKKTNPKYVPNMYDVNTPEGVEQMRIDHPEVYEAYEKFWNNKGVLNAGDTVLFASQQKPKLYQTRTEYNGEILKKFESDGNVVEKNKNGGLRLQSFSDFEIVHLIDTMQVILDMSKVGLAGQAYTKVPEFALALGGTGLKINLSLIAKDVDENGNLVFDDIEGMPFETAMHIRNMYSDNVGTILVVFNDQQLKAALADNRVDFIIPFHRSQWKKAQYEKLGLPKGTKDYTYQQNEKFIKPVFYTTRNGNIGKRKATNYMPNEYWDFSKSGKENAENYLKMCAENNKRPKFYKLLVDNKDGSYSLQPDGSTDGYWKLLIDFKMYNNDGVGVPQQPVKPDFNMEESFRMLEEYKGGHQQFPVDQETVDNFVKDYKAKHKMDAFVENEATESKAPDNSYSNFSYSLPENPTPLEIGDAYKNGEITAEEYEQRISELNRGKGKTLNPYEIANLPKDAADTTPELPKPKRKGMGDGESKLYDSFLESEIVIPELKAEIENDTFIKNYGPTTNKRTLKMAVAELEEGGKARVEEFRTMQPEKASAVDVAVGLILLERYQRANDIEGALVIAEKLREIATVSGQTVQIFSIVGRFTPEMMATYAQRDLDKAFKILAERKSQKWVDKNANKYKLTEKEKEFIVNNTVLASQLEDGSRTKAILLAEICTLIENKIPSEMGDKLRALQRVSLLLNVKTQLRNILGNGSMIPTYIASDFFGSLIDKGLSKKTGVRTVGNFQLKGSGKAFAKGMYETYDDFKRGIHTKQQELNRYNNSIKGGKAFKEDHRLKALNYVAKFCNGLDNFTSFCLEVGDRPFFEMWFNNSLNNQMRLNNVDIPTPEMLEIAKKEALQRTWQDDNMVTKSVQSVKKSLNMLHIPGTSYGLGDFVLKFTKTPANIAKAMVELSPVGLVVSISKAHNFRNALQKGMFTPAMQKELVRSLSTAITGTIIYTIVAIAASLGWVELSGEGDEDKKVSAFEKYIVGIPPYSMKIFGQNVTYDWNQPLGTVLATVADFMDSKNDDTDSVWYKDLLNAIKTGGAVFTKQSFLTGLYELFSQEDFVTGIISSLVSEPAAFIPQISSQIASLIDPYRRTTYDPQDSFKTAINGVINKIPGLRQTLPTQVNVLGEESKNVQYLNPWQAFASPGNKYPESSGKVAEEIYKLYQETGTSEVLPKKAANKITVKGNTITFTVEETAEIQKKIGKTSVELLDKLFDSKDFENLTDEQKVKAIKKVYDYAYDKAKTTLDYDYKTIAEMEGGQDVLTKEKYDKLSKEAKQSLVDEYLLTKKQRKCKGDAEKLAELFIKEVIKDTK